MLILILISFKPLVVADVVFCETTVANELTFSNMTDIDIPPSFTVVSSMIRLLLVASHVTEVDHGALSAE